MSHIPKAIYLSKSFKFVYIIEDCNHISIVHLPSDFMESIYTWGNSLDTSAWSSWSIRPINYSEPNGQMQNVIALNFRNNQNEEEKHFDNDDEEEKKE